MPKRIILTVTNDLVYDQRMQRICSSLQKNKYSVELVGRMMKDSKPLAKFPFQQTRLFCLFQKGFLFYAAFNIRLFFFLMFHKFDIVCGCDLDTLPAAFLAARLKRKKVVYDAHEYFPESPELIGRPFKQSVWHFIEKVLIPRVDAMYTVTDSIAHLFNKKYNANCKLVRNLPLKTKTKAQPSKSQISNLKPKILLYQGAVNIGRGLNEMLLTMLKLENVEFHIVGDGDEFENIKHSIKELHLNDKVKLLGKRTPEELKIITQQAYIGINLLENRGLSYYYSLGNKTFDYIQAGIPQIVIGFPEYIALNKEYHFGVVIDELYVEKIYQSTAELLKNEVLYKQLQQNCLIAKKELCWENEEKKLVNIYERLVNNN